jgi:hypothetical protein
MERLVLIEQDAEGLQAVALGQGFGHAEQLGVALLLHTLQAGQLIHADQRGDRLALALNDETLAGILDAAEDLAGGLPQFHRADGHRHLGAS